MPQQDFLTYKGKPLVRKGNEIYYGDMSEKYVIMLRKFESRDSTPCYSGRVA